MDSRENLYPLWADLSDRADAARKAYRESNGDYTARFKFRHALYLLGFDPTGVEHELRENDPNQKGGPGS